MQGLQIFFLSSILKVTLHSQADGQATRMHSYGVRCDANMYCIINEATLLIIIRMRIIVVVVYLWVLAE